MDKKIIRRSCAVPGCTSSKCKNPEKIFFPSPPVKSKALRKCWYQSMRRYDLGENTVFSVCQDHFNLETDLANKVKFDITNGKQGKELKEGVVPHIFHCQSDKQQPRKRQYSINRLKRQEHEKQILEILVEEKSKDAYTQCNFYANTINDSEINNFLEVTMQENELAKNNSESDNDWKIDNSDDDNDYLSSEDSDIDTGKIPDYYMKYPREYIGLPIECIHLLDILVKILHLPLKNIYIVLVKLRKNYTFSDIGHQFNLRKETVTRIFAKTLPILCSGIEKFIQWPSKEQIQDSLPLPFRCNFMDTECIIDCLEIETQKPENPVTQSFTFSNYKKCNTLKFLIGIVPSGMISFISKAYNGRASDMEIVKNCKFIEKLPRKMVIMADRGFKGISRLLEDQGHKLIRPPSVKAGEKLSKEEVKMTKQIASLRIHIERIIRRLREFKFLDRHSCIHSKHRKYADDMIKLAAAFVNLQPSLIKDSI